MSAPATSPDAQAGGPQVVVRGLRRVFDVSKPLIDRVLAREPRRLLKAVDGVDFDIARGETFAVVGESGSGKSTLARMVVGLLPVSAGEVTIDGVSMTSAKEADLTRLRRRIQMIFQDPYASLNSRWRVEKIIAEPIRAFRTQPDEAATRRRVGELLSLVGLSPVDGARFPHQFSGGQRQRIAIARALAATPDFIVCDEPTSALDVSVQAQILNLMKDLQDELGLTYLFISHNLAVVRHMADRIAVMYLGRFVEIAPARALFEAPLHPYSRLLLEAVPDLEMSGRPRVAVSGEIPNPINPPSGCAFHPRCPLANERCSRERPELKAHGAARVACHAVEEGRAGAPARASQAPGT